MTDAHRYESAYKAYVAALPLNADERATYLDQYCGDDAALRTEIESLLREADQARPPSALNDDVIARHRAAAEKQLSALSKSVALPDTIGRYRIVRRIASGGMGTVFEAEQDSPKRRVALKMVHAQRSTPALVERLQREGEILGRLQHPGIAQIYDAGMIDLGDGAQPYFAMEYVDGVTLTKYADAHSLDDRQRLELLALICDAMQYAHDKGVIHRDLKPDNILVDADGRPKILDFGVARITSDSTFDVSTMTRDGQILGTLSYMAPEQMDHGPDGVTHRADIYALGVLGFELLAGRLPHDVAGMSIAAALRELMDSDAPRMQTIEPRFKGDVQTIVGTALDRDPERRYASAAALAADIRRYLAHEPIHARPPSAIYKTRKFIRRNRALVGGTLATIFVLAAGIVLSSYLAAAEHEQRQIAERNARDARHGEARAVSTIIDSAVRSLEEGDIWTAVTQTQSVSDASRGWGWRIINHQLPQLLYDFEWAVQPSQPIHRAWTFFDDQSMIAHSPDWGCVRVQSIDDPTDSRELFCDLKLDAISQPTMTGLICGWNSEEAFILNVRAGTIQRRWPCPPGVMQASLSDDGRVVSMRLEQGESRVWIDETEAYQMDAHADLYNTHPHGAVSPDGRFVYFNDVTEISILETESGAIRRLPPRPPFAHIWAHVVRDGLITREYDRENSRRGRMQFHPEHSSDVEWAEEPPITTLRNPSTRFDAPADGRFAVLEGAGVSVQSLSDDVEQPLTPYERDDGSIPIGAPYNCIPRVSPSGDRIVVISHGLVPWLIDLDERFLDPTFDPRCTTFRDHEALAYHITVSHDGSMVASLSIGEPFIRLWDARTLKTIATHPRTIVEYTSRDALIAFTPNDDALIFTSPIGDREEAAVIRWDLTDGASETHYPAKPVTVGNHAPLLDVFLEQLDPQPRARLSQKAQMFETDALTIWHDYLSGFSYPDESVMHSGARWSTIAQPNNPDRLDIVAMCIHPTEPIVAAVGGLTLAPGAGATEGMLIVRDAADGAIRQQIDLPHFARSAAYSPDGSLLALGAANGRIMILETEFYTVRADFRAHDSYIYSLAWMADGHRLVTTSGNALIKIWDDRPLAERDALVAEWNADLAAARTAIDSGDQTAIDAADPAARRVARIERWATTEQEKKPATEP